MTDGPIVFHVREDRAMIRRKHVAMGQRHVPLKVGHRQFDTLLVALIADKEFRRRQIQSSPRAKFRNGRLVDHFELAHHGTRGRR